MQDKILIVDDEPNLLSSCKRILRNEPYELVTACGGAEGLVTFGSEGPFSVVISDYRMPEMDGIEFLKRIKERNPDSVRMMLSGNADLNIAVEAVNKGNIFRFMNKPCPPDILTKTIQAGIEQYRLVTAEKELLKNTLTGSISVLIDILSIVNPVAFSRAFRIRKYTHHLITNLHIQNVWQFEVAAMLSQIGCVTLPPELLEKLADGELLTTDEQKLLNTYPKVGFNLLNKIPRLENIAKMIEQQHRSFNEFGNGSKNIKQDEIAIGAQVLKVAIDFDLLISEGNPKTKALEKMSRKQGVYNPKLIDLINNLNLFNDEKGVRSITLKEIHFGMVAYEDIRASNGLLLVAKDQEITYPVIVRLNNYASRMGVQEPFRVVVPKLFAE